MSRMRLRCCALAAVVAILLTAGQARASVLVRVAEFGDGVFLIGRGSLDLSGLSFLERRTDAAGIDPSQGAVFMGVAPATDEDLYLGIVGGGAFGSGGLTNATSGTGDRVGLNGSAGLAVPAGYVSGSPLTATDFYRGQTFASLGLTPGTYIYYLTSDIITLEVGVGTAVPEPSTLAGCGLIAVALAGYRLRRRVKAA